MPKKRCILNVISFTRCHLVANERQPKSKDLNLDILKSISIVDDDVFVQVEISCVHILKKNIAKCSINPNAS